MNKKVALVFGGNGGIGYTASKRLIEDGMHVCATYNNNIDKINNISNKDDFNVYQCNVTNYNQTKKIIVDIISKFFKINVVVFSLSTSLKHTRLLDLSWDNYAEHLNLQIKSIHFATKALKDQILSKQKIKFIILLTEACLGTPPKGLSHYVASKYALMGMAKTMAIELAQFGCNVNMISPGMVDTSLIENYPPKLIEISAKQNPLKRNTTTEDVSNVISFLASDQSDFLNGANIVVNGGGVII